MNAKIDCPDCGCVRSALEKCPACDAAPCYPGAYYQPLFDLMMYEHNVVLLESQMVDIIRTVKELDLRKPPMPELEKAVPTFVMRNL